jgi:hypothetical protein
MCKPCNYRFKWPPKMCVICGKPAATGQGRKLQLCDEHREDHRSPSASPRPRRKSATLYEAPPKRTPGASIEWRGDVIEITPAGELVMNGGAPLPASPVEIILWKYIQSL